MGLGASTRAACGERPPAGGGPAVPAGRGRTEWPTRPSVAQPGRGRAPSGGRAPDRDRGRTPDSGRAATRRVCGGRCVGRGGGRRLRGWRRQGRAIGHGQPPPVPADRSRAVAAVRQAPAACPLRRRARRRHRAPATPVFRPGRSGLRRRPGPGRGCSPLPTAPDPAGAGGRSSTLRGYRLTPTKPHCSTGSPAGGVSGRQRVIEPNPGGSSSRPSAKEATTSWGRET